MATLYACALKTTPTWLDAAVCILPTSFAMVGFAAIICEYVVARQWVSAALGFYQVLMFTTNVTTYNVAGVHLIRILRNHQRTAPSEGSGSGSKSASPFDLVITKTKRSMAMLSLPSMFGVIGFLVIAVGATNNQPSVPFNPASPAWGAYGMLYLQLVLGLLFTRVCWITKTALLAEIMGRTSEKSGSKGTSGQSGNSRNSSEGPQASPDQKKSSSSADLKARAKRISQSPPRHSEERPSSTQDSRAEPEAAAVAVTVEHSPEVQGLADISLEVLARQKAVLQGSSESPAHQGSSEIV